MRLYNPSSCTPVTPQSTPKCSPKSFVPRDGNANGCTKPWTVWNSSRTKSRLACQSPTPKVRAATRPQRGSITDTESTVTTETPISFLPLGASDSFRFDISVVKERLRDSNVWPGNFDALSKSSSSTISTKSADEQNRDDGSTRSQSVQCGLRDQASCFSSGDWHETWLATAELPPPCEVSCQRVTNDAFWDLKGDHGFLFPTDAVGVISNDDSQQPSRTRMDSDSTHRRGKTSSSQRKPSWEPNEAQGESNGANHYGVCRPVSEFLAHILEEHYQQSKSAAHNVNSDEISNQRFPSKDTEAHCSQSKQLSQSTNASQSAWSIDDFGFPVWVNRDSDVLYVSSSETKGSDHRLTTFIRLGPAQWKEAYM